MDNTGNDSAVVANLHSAWSALQRSDDVVNASDANASPNKKASSEILAMLLLKKMLEGAVFALARSINCVRNPAMLCEELQALGFESFVKGLPTSECETSDEKNDVMEDTKQNVDEDVTDVLLSQPLYMRKQGGSEKFVTLFLDEWCLCFAEEAQHRLRGYTERHIAAKLHVLDLVVTAHAIVSDDEILRWAHLRQRMIQYEQTQN